MSEEEKMFCNACGGDFSAKEMMEIPVDNGAFELIHLRVCKACGEKTLSDQREAMRREFLKDYRPFTPREALDLLPGKVLRTIGEKTRRLIVAVDGDRVLAGNKWVTLEELLADYWFAGNEPCGKRVTK